MLFRIIYADLTHRLCPRVEPSSVTLDWNEGREREARVQQDPCPDAEGRRGRS